MHVRIAVADPLPLFQRGLADLLVDMGLAAETPDDLIGWLADDGPKIVLLTVVETEHWALLDILSPARSNGHVVVALLADASFESQVRAVRAGASAVVARDAASEQMRDAVLAAIDGRAHLSVNVLRAAVDHVVERQEQRTLSADERRWLQSLASGVTVADLAEQDGYSERMMFRMLKTVYSRLGAASRTEALMTARSAGWI